MSTKIIKVYEPTGKDPRAVKRIEEPWVAQIPTKANTEESSSRVLPDKQKRKDFLRLKKAGRVVVKPALEKRTAWVSHKVNLSYSRDERSEYWNVHNRWQADGVYPGNLARSFWYERLRKLPGWDRSWVQENYISALAEANENVDVLTALAEMPEMIAMLQSFIKTLRQPLTAVPKLIKVTQGRGSTRTRVNLREMRKFAADQWLQYRYGIMPTIYLIQDLATAINTQISPFSVTRATDKTEETFDQIERVTYSFFNRELELRFRHIGTVSVEKRIFVKRLLDLANYSPFGGNLVKTAWELVPLSFVIDWVIQVGDAISAFCPPAYLSQGATASSKVMLKGYTLLELDARAGDKIAPPVMVGSFVHSEYNRIVLEETPGLATLALPQKLSLNWKRVIDSWGLFWPETRRHFSTISTIIREQQHVKTSTGRRSKKNLRK